MSLSIGLVCPYALEVPGGVQNHVIGLAGYLRRAGHEVAVLAPGRPTAEALRGAGLPADRFTDAGRTVPIRYNGSVARVTLDLRAARRVIDWLTHGRFDVVHVHEPLTPGVGLAGLARSTAPVVATFHSANPRSRAMSWAGRLFRAPLERIHTRIAVSRSADEVVRRHLGLGAVIIPNGFSAADFTRVPLRPRRPGTPPRLLFLGRISEGRKGLPVLLAALPALRRAHPDLEVLVAGDGRRPLPPGCLALGRVTDAERARLLGLADVFVAPHVARESFGLVLIEAMAAGAPVVASDLGAFTDVLAGTGRTFTAGRPDELVDAVLATLSAGSHDLLRQRERARRRAERYDWSMVGPAIEEVYRRAAGARARRGLSTAARVA